MGPRIITGQEIVDLARFPFRQDCRTSELDGKLVLLGIKDFQRAGDFVEKGAARLGCRSEPLPDESFEVGLGSVFRTPERRALVDATLEIPGRAGMTSATGMGTIPADGADLLQLVIRRKIDKRRRKRFI